MSVYDKKKYIIQPNSLFFKFYSDKEMNNLKFQKYRLVIIIHKKSNIIYLMHTI